MSEISSPNPRITVAMIVRDAEHDLVESIRSVAGLTDEIVVCDTGSIDGTVQIAEQLATRVVHHIWEDDFAAARNECLEHCTGDWILWLDVGESLAEESALPLREFVNLHASPNTAYMLAIKLPPQNVNTAGEQVGRLRLIPNHTAIRFQGRVRETVDTSLAAAGMEIEDLACDVWRRPAEHSQQVRVRKAKRNLQLAQSEMDDNGVSARMLTCLADAYAMLGEKTKSAEYCRMALAHAEPHSTEMLEAYFGLLTALDGSAGAVSAQTAVCLEALEAFPLDVQLLCAMGGYMQQHGRPDLAVRSYEVAYRNGQIDPEAWHLQNIVDFAATCFAASLQMSDRTDEALAILEEAVMGSNPSPQIRRHLIDLYIKMLRQEDAVRQVDQLPPDTPDREALRSAVRGASLAAKKNWIAARSYLEAAFDAGCRDPLCLRWSAVTAIALGNFGRAASALEEWRFAGPVTEEIEQFEQVLSQAMSNRRVDGAEQGQTPTPTHATVGAESL